MQVFCLITTSSIFLITSTTAQVLQCRRTNLIPSPQNSIKSFCPHQPPLSFIALQRREKRERNHKEEGRSL